MALAVMMNLIRYGLLNWSQSQVGWFSSFEAFVLLSSVDFFLLALVVLVYSFFQRARQEHFFDDLILAGIPPDRHLAPLIDLLFGLFMLDAILESSTALLLGSEALEVRLLLGAAAIIYGFCLSWLLALLIVLLNLRNVGVAAQVFLAAILFIVSIFCVSTMSDVISGLWITWMYDHQESAILKWLQGPRSLPIYVISTWLSWLMACLAMGLVYLGMAALVARSLFVWKGSAREF